MDHSMTVITRVLVSSLFVCLIAQASFAQNEVFVGNWQANIAMSRYDPGPGPQSETMRIESVNGAIKVSLDGVNQQGPYHSESTGKFDGVDVPVLATPARSATFTYAFSTIDSHTWEIAIKVNGQRRITVRNVVSADGRTITSTSTAVTTQGTTVSQVVLYEKQ
jgi:hypothetical protein